MSLGLRRLTLSTALSAFAVAASISAFSASAAQDSMVIYNGQHKDATAALIEAFEKKTNIKVESRDGNSNELAHQVIAEGDKAPADVIYTEGSSPQEMLARQGLPARINDDAWDNVPEGYRAVATRWPRLCGRARVVEA